MSLSHEAQRVGAVECLFAGWEVGTRHRFVDWRVEADVDSADGVGEQDESEQTDFGVVVDGDAGQIRDRSDERFRPASVDFLSASLSDRPVVDQLQSLGFLGGTVTRR